MWREVDVTVNGYSYVARCSDEAYDHAFRPLLERLVALQRKEGRRVVAFLAGPPAVGKSTLVSLLERFAEDVPGCELQTVGLDGFHHYNSFLRSHTIERDDTCMPLSAIKGAPETFDAARFAEKLRQLHQCDEVPWPVYDRTIHDPREDAVLVTAPIVVVEGNWLLLDEEPWASLGELADLTVFVEAEEAALRERAVTRKAAGGISRAEAEAHYERADGPNIRRVLEGSRPADVTLRMTEDGDIVMGESRT